MPFRASDNVDHPLNLYGATKKSNELMAHAYAHLFAMPATGLRFFTVYGPWGRPDMAMWLFAAAICDGKPIRLFNSGKMRRDFTYIDDVTEAVVRLVDAAAAGGSGVVPRCAGPGDQQCSLARLQYRQQSAGGSAGNRSPASKGPWESRRCVSLCRCKRATSPETYADCADLERAVSFRPRTPIEDGVRLFVEWFREFRNLR